MPRSSDRHRVTPGRRTDAEVLAILAEAQRAADERRARAGQHVGARAALLWGYRGLATLAGESDSSARRRAARMVAAGTLERLPGVPVMFRLARVPPSG